LHLRPRGGGHRAACRDSLLIGLYVLADELFIDRRGPGRPRKITGDELSHKRLVVDDLVTVRILPSIRRGAGWTPATVDVPWKEDRQPRDSAGQRAA
jgi:hypothetical protein